MARTLLPTAAAAVLVLCAASAGGADLAGVVFRDRDGNGVQDPGEEGIGGAAVEVFGALDAGGAVDRTVPAAADGTFALGPGEVGDGCFALRVDLPAGFRLARARADCPGTGLPAPVGTRRYAAPRHLIDGLRDPSAPFLHLALGDSIAEPASICAIGDATDYVGWLGDRLACVKPGAVTVNDAIAGKRTPDLLRPAGTCGPGALHPLPLRCDNVFDAIARNPDLVTISIGGNDWLGAEPSNQTEPFDPAEVKLSVDALVDTRRNLQELLSVLASELPTTDVIVNTVYDNRAGTCASSDFHRVWAPIWNQVIRDVTWGQGERFAVAEVYPEYAHEDLRLGGAACCGATGQVCLDGIHPTAAGAKRHLEKVWDAAGGVALGPRDGIGATSNPDLAFPAEELVAVRWPTAWDDRTAGAVDPDAALARDDRGARVPAGTGELRLRGFDATPAGITPTHVVLAVRYRTDAAPPAGAEGDAYAFEASLDGTFAPAQDTVTGWDTVVPIVGAGTNAPAPNALPDVPRWREARALLTKPPADDGRARGSYAFPAVSWSDVATLAVRLAGTTRGAGADAFHVEWDAAWLEVYGYGGPGLVGVYRSVSPVDLVAPSSRIAWASGSSYDDAAPPPATVVYYAVADGSMTPLRLDLVKVSGFSGLRWQ